jgi:hypothetical protein
MQAKSNAKKKRKTPIKKQQSFLDLIGSGAGEITVEEAKKMLDEMRAEDDD